ncbi:MAG: hypothetical protein JW912_03885 [Sedimentisphaerales bacterium]|nr:hypothetical protein [Sedimentisphaerales bacterium]
MKKLSAILAIYLVITGASFARPSVPIPQEDASPPKPPVLAEGYVFSGENGIFKFSKDDNKWIFVIDDEQTDGRAIVESGKPIELITSNMLEKMTVNMDKNNSAAIKLWAKVIKYNDKNYLFPWYFIPMTNLPGEQQIQDPNMQQETDRQQELEEEQEDDDSILPDDVMKLLKPKRVVNLAKLRQVVQAEGNAILAERTGFIVEKDGQKILQIDSLGRNVDEMSFKLLPSEVLEWSEYRMERYANPMRLRIAGIVTMYKGEYYILLERAARAYNHGNFVR